MLIKILGLGSRFIISFSFLVVSLSLFVLFFWADFLSQDLRIQAAENIVRFLNAPWYIHFPPVLLALLVWFLATWSLRTEFSKPAIVAFTTDSGPVQVSLNAVREHAIQVCEGIPGVKKVLDVSIQARPAGIDSIRLKLILLKGHSVPTVTNQCKDRVKEEMGRTLGIERVNLVIPYIERVEDSLSGSPETELSTPPAFRGETPDFSQPDGGEYRDDTGESGLSSESNFDH